MLGTNLAEILYCTRCGACLNICPVYRHVGGHAYDSVYPGPIGAVVTPGLGGLEAAVDLPHASSLCGACRDVCPVRIDLPRLLLELRAEGAKQDLGPAWLRMAMTGLAELATRPALYRLAGRLAGRIGALLTRDRKFRSLPGPLAGWTASRDFPVPASRSFVEQWQDARGKKGDVT